MDRRRLRQVAPVVLLAVVAACGGAPGGSGSTSASPSAGVEALRYACGEFPFGPELLTAPQRNDEDAGTPIAAALRQFLVQPGIEIDSLPDDGWTLIGESARAAEFVTVGDDLGLQVVYLADNGGWEVTGWGGCRPQVVLAPGLGPAIWEWGSEGSPGPQTRTFDALVTEMECASGQSSEGRVVGPQVIRTNDQVLVTFAVRSLGGGDCPSNPSTRVPVDLGEPLGDRDLLDAGELPFRDPTVPRF
ncbi:MAG: hypothetical protein AB1736_14235 [Chloroflexota bacterium]